MLLRWYKNNKNNTLPELVVTDLTSQIRERTQVLRNGEQFQLHITLLKYVDIPLFHVTPIFFWFFLQK
jgi:hypothetical protein